ncbi:addiction module protein [Algoriphagus formosus]|uniref:Addiction module protein n=1 Tax=Algoriphagus formosus TaxID=2007308 RepID=A0A4R5VGS9_9BACT|nr:addiction module protein [Algoriphagus aquimaris]TDK51041.1 addiction module protein [Algoriphagus aquimaris]
MDTLSLKLDLIQWLTELDDKNTLLKLYALKKEKEGFVSSSHKKLLDERIKFFKENPEELLDWEIEKERIEEGL